MKIGMIRHGDVQLIPIRKDIQTPEVFKKAMALGKHLKGRVEVAFGEVTGHAHRLELDCLFQNTDGQLFLKKDKLPMELTHEEHKNATLTDEVYHACITRVYDEANGWRETQD